ncbi:MAG: hypothetical protein MR598_04490 [Erysipelotrichaceae bacterium]|nr:hypothetical protein [Erysipelotrichaceae bacterium]
MKKDTKKEMKKNIKLRELIFPNKKINFFVTTILILGILSGSIFLMMSNEVDKNSVIDQIQNFFKNIANGSIDNGLAFRNSLIINYIFVGLIWVLGLSMIGVIVNIFLTYIKGFLVGFSISSIILTYGYKGVLASVLYTFFSQVFHVLVVIMLSIYSIMFSKNLLYIIGSKKNSNNRLMLKKYIVILMFCIIISFISSIMEVYLFPNVLKLIISLYV